MSRKRAPDAQADDPGSDSEVVKMSLRVPRSLADRLHVASRALPRDVIPSKHAAVLCGLGLYLDELAKRYPKVQGVGR